MTDFLAGFSNPGKDLEGLRKSSTGLRNDAELTFGYLELLFFEVWVSFRITIATIVQEVL